MKCPNCGSELEPGKIYCEHCGHEIQIVADCRLYQNFTLRVNEFKEDNQNG